MMASFEIVESIAIIQCLIDKFTIFFQKRLYRPCLQTKKLKENLSFIFV